MPRGKKKQIKPKAKIEDVEEEVEEVEEAAGESVVCSGINAEKEIGKKAE